MSTRVAVRALTLFVTLALIALVVHETDLGAALTPRWGDRLREIHGIIGPLLFVVAGSAFTAVGLPRQALAFVAGHAFGLWEGMALAVVATTLGCVLAFCYARFFGRGLVRARHAERVRRIDRFLAVHPFSMTLLIRFLPIGNNLVTNLAAGVSSVPAGAFFVGSAIGYLPQGVIFALLGGGTTLPAWVDVVLGGTLFAVSGALGVGLYRRYRRGDGVFDDVTEHDLVPDELDPAGYRQGGD